MGKNRQRNKDKEQQQQQQQQQQQLQQQQQQPSARSSSGSFTPETPQSVLEWCYAERHGLLWVSGCALVGMLLGLGIGTGHLTGAAGQHSPWRAALACKIRSSFWYEVILLRKAPWAPIITILSRIHGDVLTASSTPPDTLSQGVAGVVGVVSNKGGTIDPDHPRAFQTLREMIIREEGGYVHPDLGMLIPAPSGAARGFGMTSDSYHSCQTHCFPGIASEINSTSSPPFHQQEVLVRVPLDIQMTRAVALQTLLPLLPHDTRRRAPLEDLDDAALLVLLLSHERGRGRESRFQPYIAALPKEPTCGYSPSLRQQAVETVQTLGNELGLDVNGWPAEITKAADYAERIAGGLTRDYGNHIAVPKGLSAFSLIQWSICQVASRATAGNAEYGALRLVPLIDLINHDAEAGGMVELTGEETIANGDFIDATENDAGTFTVRSLRHGRRRSLKRGQELLVNYNVPQYSPLDWFISLGFVPPERSNRWIKIDNALPRVRSEYSQNVIDVGDHRTPLTVIHQPRPEL